MAPNDRWKHSVESFELELPMVAILTFRASFGAISTIRSRDIRSFVSFVGMPWNNTPIRWISPGICRIFGSYLTSLVLSLNLHSFLFLVALSLAHHSSNSPPGAIQGAFLDSIFRQHRPSHSMSYSKKLVSTLYVAI